MLEMRRLRLLRELKLRGTIGAVADALSFSPSSVSQQLAQLEREAGVPLLRRVGRRVVLTPQAEILVEHTTALLERLERAETEVNASLANVSGTIRVAAFQSALLALVPPALTILRDDYPDLRVEITMREPSRACTTCGRATTTSSSPSSTRRTRHPGRPTSTARSCAWIRSASASRPAATTSGPSPTRAACPG